MRRALPFAAALAACLSIAAPAGAASVAYIEDHNLWLSSPDGALKHQVTTGGTADYPWQAPSQGPDGRTVVVHKDTFEGDTKRPVLYFYDAAGKLITANVMPVYSGATIPVYPIGLDMDWKSNAVAYGYSYCTFACNSTVQGYWLTFADNQGLYPSDPQGQSGFYSPTFYGTRVVASDSGGRIFIQPDVPEAPFTSSYQGWLAVDGYRLRRAELSMNGNLVAIDWVTYDGNGTLTGQGIAIGRHDGTVPGDVHDLCDVPVAGGAGQLTFSPDGTQMAWSDDEGVKVAGTPNLAAGTGVCTLTAPPKVISATGKSPSFGGADVAAIKNPGGGQPQPGGAPATGSTGAGSGTATPGGGSTAQGAPPAPIRVTVSGRATRTLFARGRVKVAVDATSAGPVAVSATVPARIARRYRLGGARKATLARAASAKGIAAAAGVVVARGSAKAAGAGRLAIALKPTRQAKRAAKKLRNVTLTVRVTQGPAAGSARIKLR